MKELTENQLSASVQSWDSIVLLMKEIHLFPQHVNALMKLVLDDSEPRNWRAAWMLDKIHDAYPELIVPLLPQITDHLMHTQDTGKKRHLLKLISLHRMAPEMMVPLLKYCSEVFTSAKEPVAVRVHAMQVLFNLALEEPDLTGELIDLIENEIELHGSPGISSRGKKLLKRLYAMRN